MAINFDHNSNSITPDSDRLTIDATGSLILPVGSTAQRINVQGSLRYNSETNQFEGYNGSTWTQVSGGGSGGAVDSVNGQTGIVVLDTDDIAEASNLYYTTARANSAIDARVTKTFVDNLNVDADTLDSQDGTYYLDYTNFTNTPSIPSSTTDITEGTNLYYTNERVDDRVAALLIAGTNVTITYNDVLGTLTIDAVGGGGGAVDSVNGQTGVVVLDTDDIAEGGTNLYYTDTRANSAIDARVNKAFIDALNVDADTLDGIDSTAFAQRATNNTFTGNNVFTTLGVRIENSADSWLVFKDTSEVSGSQAWRIGATSTHFMISPVNDNYASPTGFFRIDRDGGLGTTQSIVTRSSGDARYVQIANFDENIDDKVANLLVAGTNITLAYDDGAGTLTVALDNTGGLPLGNNTTTDLAEGSNLYYTTVRANSAIDARVTKTFVDNLNVDADTLDGLDSTDFVQLTGNQTINGEKTFTSTITIEDPQPSISFVDSQGTGSVAEIHTNNGNLDLRADINNDHTNSRITFSIDGSEVIRIDNNGNVGIGVSNPGEALDVSGNVDITGEYRINGVAIEQYSSTDFDTDFGAKDTDDLSEGATNLYYTDTRANAAIDTRVNKSFVDALNVDADTLDGIDSSGFGQINNSNTWNFRNSFTNVLEVLNSYFNMTVDGNKNQWMRRPSDNTAEALFQFAPSFPAFRMFYYDSGGVNEREVAFFDDAGTTLSWTTSVVTREKGDNRYLQLTGGSLTGPISVSGGPITSNAQLQAFQDGATALAFRRNDINWGMGLFAAGGALAVSQEGVNLARFDPVGTVSPDVLTIQTREKADARYLQLQGGGNVTSVLTLQMNANNALRINRADIDKSMRIGLTSTGELWGYDTSIDGTDPVREFFRFDQPGPNLDAAYSVVTQEKGDARYLRLTPGNTPVNATLIVDCEPNDTLTSIQIRARDSDNINELSFRRFDGGAADRFDIRAQLVPSGNSIASFRFDGTATATFFKSGFASFAGAAQAAGFVSLADFQCRTDLNPSMSLRKADGTLNGLMYLNRGGASGTFPGRITWNLYNEDGSNGRIVAQIEDRIADGGALASAQSVITREYGDDRYGQTFTHVGNNQTVFTGDMNTLFGPNASSSYFCNADATNGPEAAIAGTLLVQTHPTNGNFVTQTFIESSSVDPRTWVRARGSGVWSSWVQITNQSTPAPMTIDFHAAANASAVITNQPAAERWFLNAVTRSIKLVPFTGQTQGRIVGHVNVAGVAASYVRFFYNTGSYSTNIANYTSIRVGGANAEFTLTSTGYFDSGWFDLDVGLSGLNDDAFIGARDGGGNGTADPQIGHLSLYFR